MNQFEEKENMKAKCDENTGLIFTGKTEHCRHD